MKIIFSAKGDSWDSLVDPRFGRAEMFLLFDEESKNLISLSNEEAKQKAHGVGLQSAKKVIESGAKVVITGNGAGEKALEILQKSDIKVFIGAGDLTIKEAYDAYKNGSLKTQF